MSKHVVTDNTSGFFAFFFPPHILAAQVAVPPRVPVPGQKGRVVRSVFQTLETRFRQLIQSFTGNSHPSAPPIALVMFSLGGES